jgi:hypothetical protein
MTTMAMDTSTSSPHLQQLIEKFESKTGSFRPPSTIEFYRFGLVLCDLLLASSDDDNHVGVFETYDNYLETLPSSYLSTVMKDLTAAFQSVISNHLSALQASAIPDVIFYDIVDAARSIAGLCSRSSTACRASYSVQLCGCLASSYDAMMLRKDQYGMVSMILLKTLEALWINGLIPSLQSNPTDNGDEEASMQQTMELVEALIAEDKNTFLGDALHLQSQRGVTAMINSLRTTFQEDTPQRDYLLKMMESSSKSGDLIARSTAGGVSSTKSAPVTKKIAVNARTEIQRRIQQVKDVLPDLGEGYIESVLSHFGGDVARTVAALFDPSSLPPAFQMLDSKLPARRQENAISTTTYHLDDQEARDVTKERLISMEREQEAVAYALTNMGISENNVTGGADEYNDDYDDQYDGMDAGENLGGTGGTYDDVDIETVRVYNRVARAAEQEQDFWEQSRNTNRRGPPSQNIHRNKNKKKDASAEEESNEDDEGGEGAGGRSYRGPNKIRGGRVVGLDGKVLPRQLGGKKGKTHTPVNQNKPATGNPQKQKEGGDTATAATNADLTKIQKRRKNDNKAKIGNHHRKDRAQKKAAGGM